MNEIEPHANRRKMTWAQKGGCKVKPCENCRIDFKPPTSGNLYCDICRPAILRKTHRDGSRTWRLKNRLRHRKVKMAWDLKKYGLSLDDYDSMLKAQAGRCAICRREEIGGRGILRKLAVDHCHLTGCVRGLLCNRCNAALGMVRDDASVLRAMILYLEKPR